MIPALHFPVPIHFFNDKAPPLSCFASLTYEGAELSDGDGVYEGERRVENIKTEIVIGIAGPAGTDLTGLAQTIKEKLSPFGYRCREIRVSELIKSHCVESVQAEISKAKHGDMVGLLMNAGDALRKQARRGDALIPLVVSSICTARKHFFDSKNPEYNVGVQIPEFPECLQDLPASRACYIINSLKHPAEVKELRRVYGKKFILISGFSSKQERMANLCEKIAKSYNSTQNDRFIQEANDLIDLDAKRPGEKLGQSLRDTFPLADFFVRVSGDYYREVERFIDLFFGSPYITPRISEFYMFEARAKSYRSADLSRQVGAVIVDTANDLVSSGCNEVPVAGGGSYWPDEDVRFDNRDYKTGRDYNAVKKYEIIEEFIEFLSSEKIINIENSQSVSDAIERIIVGPSAEKFKDLRVSSLIEFGRVVHAEMNAITEAARRGLGVGGGTLYCTTFPCHMCARHVISSGIIRVVYIEPYPKSMTAELYGESVIVDGESVSDVDSEHLDHRKVVFAPFEGVAPSVYPELYRAGNRKDERGYRVSWSKAGATPKMVCDGDSHIDFEDNLVKELEKPAYKKLTSIPDGVGSAT